MCTVSLSRGGRIASGGAKRVPLHRSGRRVSALLLGVLLAALTGCGTAAQVTVIRSWEQERTASVQTAATQAEALRVGMVTDVAGVEDQGFNQSAWEGLLALTDLTGAETAYKDSNGPEDFLPNFDRLTEEGFDLCWGVGFDCAEAILASAQKHPDVHFAIVDSSYEDTPKNLTSVVFRAQEPSFLVGYIAAGATKTGKVGFVGGVQSDIIDQFEYGFRAGVAYMNAQEGRDVAISSAYIGNFWDAEAGKTLAMEMYDAGCDIVYQAAGGGGLGVIDAAVETGNFAIGVDKDQGNLAPANILTSAMKKVDVAVLRVSEDFVNGADIGGRTLSFGMTDGAVGVPEHRENYSGKLYDAMLLVADDIQSGKLVPPASEEAFQAFLAALQEP